MEFGTAVHALRGAEKTSEVPYSPSPRPSLYRRDVVGDSRATRSSAGREDGIMPRYGKKASDKVAKVMRERKRGTLRSGGSGKKVTSRKQAIAIGLSEARRAGAKVPRKKSRSRRSRS
jgi:hypothetical protein